MCIRTTIYAVKKDKPEEEARRSIGVRVRRQNRLTIPFDKSSLTLFGLTAQLLGIAVSPRLALLSPFSCPLSLPDPGEFDLFGFHHYRLGCLVGPMP
jgi:hypothetical protein